MTNNKPNVDMFKTNQKKQPTQKKKAVKKSTTEASFLLMRKDGIKTKDSDMLVDYIIKTREDADISLDTDIDIPCPKCEKRHIFKTFEDLPIESHKCTCGSLVVEYIG